jgi:hypothetical protein
VASHECGRPGVADAAAGAIFEPVPCGTRPRLPADAGRACGVRRRPSGGGDDGPHPSGAAQAHARRLAAPARRSSVRERLPRLREARREASRLRAGAFARRQRAWHRAAGRRALARGDRRHRRRSRTLRCQRAQRLDGYSHTLRTADPGRGPRGAPVPRRPLPDRRAVPGGAGSPYCSPPSCSASRTCRTRG